MSLRLDYTRIADQEPLLAMSALSGYLHASDLEPGLLALVQLRASQLNGCAYCVDMHTKDLQALGERPERLYLLAVWQEADVYTEAERAVLAWTEALTQLHAGIHLDAVYSAMSEHYDDANILRITFAIIAINSWNRLSVATGRSAGNYKPGDHDAMLQLALQKLRR